jgi:hypothetical protein
MKTTEIIELLPTLSIEDRIEIATIALNSIREQQSAHKLENKQQIDSQLRMAASLAVDDYTNDRELTIFTCLDGEDFLE